MTYLNISETVDFVVELFSFVLCCVFLFMHVRTPRSRLRAIAPLALFILAAIAWPSLYAIAPSLTAISFVAILLTGGFCAWQLWKSTRRPPLEAALDDAEL